MVQITLKKKKEVPHISMNTLAIAGIKLKASKKLYSACNYESNLKLTGGLCFFYSPSFTAN